MLIKKYYHRLPIHWRTRLKHAAKFMLRLAKRGYQQLPFSIKTKAQHRKWIAKLSPRLLTATGSYPGDIPTFQSPLNQSPLLAQVLQHPETLEIPSSATPRVSIIIPIYGKVEYTLRCLASIALNPPQTTFEVIVVNDCSPDNSHAILSQIKGVRLLSNTTNQGFIRSCNAGAKHAYGEYLLFLNNDTEVFPAWLDELLRTFVAFPGTGLVGSKLIYPNGLLQEAGGIIWQDGSAWNFGHNQDPALPLYNYAREVDYCSGASIMLPATLFKELGGFDELYLPAYCEDSDLALKVRSKGYRVIYQPLSVVVHYEGITSGTDLTQGTKAYQVINSQKQFDRWHDYFKNLQPNGIDVDRAKDRTAKWRVLFLDHCTPTPNKDSGSIDAYNQMLLLREMGFQVTFIPEDNFFYMPDYTPELQRQGIEVLYAPYTSSVTQHLKEYGRRYNLIFISRLTVFERHIKTVHHYCPQAKVLFHTVDLHFLRQMREAELQQSSALQQYAEEVKQRELLAMQTADLTTIISSDELALIKKLIPNAKLQLLPYARAINPTLATFSERQGIVFIGSYQHPPNVDAVNYFSKEIMPLLRAQQLNIMFYIVGSHLTPEVEALASEDIIVQGFVNKLNPFLNKIRIAIAPLRYGAGIKGKIGTALCAGLPVVATTLASEGMGLQHEQEILLADTPQAFATAIARLYQDEVLWKHLRQQGLRYAEQAWGAETAWQNLAATLANLGIEVTRNTHPLRLYSESD